MDKKVRMSLCVDLSYHGHHVHFDDDTRRSNLGLEINKDNLSQDLTLVKEEFVDGPVPESDNIYVHQSNYATIGLEPVSADDDGNQVRGNDADISNKKQQYSRIGSPRAEYLDLDTSTGLHYTQMCTIQQCPVGTILRRGQGDMISSTTSASVHCPTQNHETNMNDKPRVASEGTKTKDCEVSSTTCLTDSSRVVYPWMKICPSPSKLYIITNFVD